MRNGFASLKSGGAQGTKHNKKPDGKDLVMKGYEISNMEILSTPAKYLWKKDYMELRLRVLTAALGFLVGAKVSSYNLDK